MNRLDTSTLRPGLLVSMRTSIKGNIKYAKETVEPDHTTPEGARRAKWETEREISDPVEYDAARKARQRARTLIAGVCAASAFGYLCPQDKVAELEAAITEARREVEAFNGGATVTRVGVYVITGRVAPDDAEAIRAINGEVTELMQGMESAIANLDPKAIRDAAARVKQLGAMLTPEAAGKVEEAVAVARAAAKKIVKAGETAAQEVDRAAIAKIMASRTMFLDLDEVVALVDTPAAESRGVDLDPDTEEHAVRTAASAPAPALEF